MKQKQRVPKGEKYWYIIYGCDGFEAEGAFDNYLCSDKLLFESGNYFTSLEEAGRMIRKLCAVLKGADVVEMPESNEVDMILREIGIEVGGEDEELVEAAVLGAIRMINWLIDKIVK